MAGPVRTHAREDARSRPWPALSQAWRRRALPYRRPRKLVGRTREDEDIAMTRPPRQLLEWQPPRAGRPRRRSSSLLAGVVGLRSEEHTSELQSLMRNSYAVFCLKK